MLLRKSKIIAILKSSLAGLKAKASGFQPEEAGSIPARGSNSSTLRAKARS